MKRSKKLILLLGVLVLVSVAAFAALHHQEQVEQIRTTDEIILELPTDSIQAVSWEQNGTSLAFHRSPEAGSDETAGIAGTGAGKWLWDEDSAFPVADSKLDAILEPFASFGAAFRIEDVEDYGQYGLDTPVCTIHLTATAATAGTEEQSVDIALGNFSNMDEQRYVSIGDGNVYLVKEDPMEDFEAERDDFLLHDTIPSLGTPTEIRFTGIEDRTISYAEDSPASYDPQDVYFTQQQDGSTLPLDPSRISAYLQDIRSLSLSDYVTYNATPEELEQCGLTDPELTVTVTYPAGDQEEDGTQPQETFVLHVSRDPEELAASQEAQASGGSPSAVSGYVRIGDSQLIYSISGEDCQDLLDCTYNGLRHPEVFSAGLDSVSQLDISLEGSTYTITAQQEETDSSTDTRTWTYEGEETDLSALETALSAMEATDTDSFTDQQPTGLQEISLTLHLDNENFPTLQIALYRQDASSCLAVVDGQPFALVPRSDVVDLVEAVHGIVL